MRVPYALRISRLTSGVGDSMVKFSLGGARILSLAAGLAASLPPSEQPP